MVTETQCLVIQMDKEEVTKEAVVVEVAGVEEEAAVVEEVAEVAVVAEETVVVDVAVAVEKDHLLRENNLAKINEHDQMNNRMDTIKTSKTRRGEIFKPVSFVCSSIVSWNPTKKWHSSHRASN